MANLRIRQMPAYPFYFRLKQSQILFNRIVTVDDLGVTATEPAKLPAERQVEVQGEGLIALQLMQPSYIIPRGDVFTETHRGGIAGIPGDPLQLSGLLYLDQARLPPR